MMTTTVGGMRPGNTYQRIDAADVPRRRVRHLSLVAVVCVLAAGVSACGARDPFTDPDSAASRVEREIAERRLADDEQDYLQTQGSGGTERLMELARGNASAGPQAVQIDGGDTSSPTGSAASTTTSQAPRSATDRAVAATAGKGQYLYRMENIGTPAQVVEKAKAVGLKHLIIRASNPVDGFYVRPILEDLLPLAHANGISVVAYDGPALEDIPSDVARAKEVIEFQTTTGHRVDALGSDIERTRAPNLDRPRAAEYAKQLRAAVGPEYPLIAIVMNPNYHESWYPFAELATGFNVMSPMDYWTGVTQDGGAFVARSVELLQKYGLPVSVIGQAYPIEVKGSYPTPDAVDAAMSAAKDGGAVGISWWSWEDTTDWHWDRIAAFQW